MIVPAAAGSTKEDPVPAGDRRDGKSTEVHNNMKRKLKLAAAVVGVTAVITFGAAALAAAGDSTDPLVTLSYLNNIFAPSVTAKVDEAVAANETNLKNELNAAIQKWEGQLQSQGGGSSSAFSVVTLTKGQKLEGSVGCEIMLRVGTATCLASGSPGLIDSTDGTTLSAGSALVTNHLYMVTVDTRTVSATADTVKLLVRGSYTIS